jgi:hypothetical protein
MAVAAIAVGNLTSPALYVASFHVELFQDAGYTQLVGSKACQAVKDSSGNWVQSDLIGFDGLVRGQTYYIQAGPVSPGGVANFNRYSVQAGTITIPASTYTGTFTSTSSGVSYDITPASVPSDIDHYEAIWTKDGSAPSNSSLENNWQGLPLPNGVMHLFVGGSPGQNIHLFVRGVSTSGGYQNWVAVDNRTVSPSGSGSLDASDILYADGTSVESLKPGQAGADITGVNVAADTQAVNGINSGHISDTAVSIGFLGKWWRTSEANKYPVGGGELNYAPMFTTHDSRINYNIWGDSHFLGASPLPPVPSGNGSWIYVRWTGYFTCSTDGTYTFGTNSDDGSNFILNGSYIVNDLGSRHGSVAGNLVYQNSGTVYLFAGHTYAVVVEYHQEDNNGGIQVMYTPPGGSVQLLDIGAAFSNAAFTQYADGTPVDSLKPAAAGADVTAVNVSADTSSVNGRAASDVAQTVLAGGGVDYLHQGNANIPQNATSLIIRGSFEDGSVGNWSGTQTVSVTGEPFLKAMKSTHRDIYESGNWFIVSPGQRIYVYGWYNTQNCAEPASIGVQFASADVQYTWVTGATLASGQGWTQISGYLEVPANAVKGTPWIQINKDEAVVDYVLVANLYMSKTAVVDFSESTHINKNADNIPYTDGTTIQALKPAQAGADVTGLNTANNTNNVGSTSASVISQVVPNGGMVVLNAGGRVFSVQSI